MQGPDETRINPLKEEALFMRQLRNLIFKVAPYEGVLSVTFLGTTATDEEGEGPLRYISLEGRASKGFVPRFGSIDEPGASESLLNFLVAFYQDMLQYGGDIVVALHEAAARDPLAGTFGKTTIYLEFGGVGASDYC